MEKIFIGKFVKTHGIKGEIKVRSNFKYKNKVFKEGFKIYISDQEFIINSYRIHQEYDMLTFKGIENINDIFPYKGSDIYINKEDLKLENNEFLDSDLINLEVYMDSEFKGIVQEINYLNKDKKLLMVSGKLVPFELIKEINFDEKKIELERVDGLL